MFERFTDLARRVVVLAQEEARMLNHNYIGTEHLLLGLLHEDRGLARQALTELDVSLQAVREQVMTIIGPGERAPSGHIPFTPRAKKVLELALREALQLGTDYIGTEHLLLGLIREGQGVAAQVLSKLGKSLDEVRQTVVRLYEQQPPEEREQQNRETGERVREREEPAGFEPRFPMPGFLRARSSARAAASAATVREFGAPAAPRPQVRATDPVAERPAESARLLAVLARRERNNALLVGPSGAGKSALVRGLSQTLAGNRGPASLGSAEVLELDLAALRGGADRIVRRNAPVVLVEDLDMLLRADDLSGGRLVMALAGLAEAESPLVVTGSAEARERLEQGFPTLATRFESVEVGEAGTAHAFDVLTLLRPGLQDFHGITIDDSALTAAIELAPRVLGGRVLPGGAVDLLDAAAARLAVRGEPAGDTSVLREGHLRDAA
jgi:ATP-dependent Clp protease ATP-binding subunit ClpC